MSWNQSGKRKEAVGYGSNMITVTPWAARSMANNFEACFYRGHWDISLKEACGGNEEFRMEVFPSFLFPAVGHFDSHASSRVAGPLVPGRY